MKFLSALLVAIGALAMVAGQPAEQPSWPNNVAVHPRDLSRFQNRLLSLERNANMNRMREAISRPEGFMSSSSPSARISSPYPLSSARSSRSPLEGLENLPLPYSSFSPLAGENSDSDSSSDESPAAPGGKQIQAPRGTIRHQTAAPLVMSARTLQAQSLPDQKAKFTVPLTKNHVENVEQPIIQRVVQPYTQRIVRQPKPVVQPYNTRVIQPLIQQEITPVLSTTVETAKPMQAEFLSPIQNADVVLAPRTSSTTKPLQRTAPRVSGKKSH